MNTLPEQAPESALCHFQTIHFVDSSDASVVAVSPSRVPLHHSNSVVYMVPTVMLQVMLQVMQWNACQLGVWHCSAQAATGWMESWQGDDCIYIADGDAFRIIGWSYRLTVNERKINLCHASV